MKKSLFLFIVMIMAIVICLASCDIIGRVPDSENTDHTHAFGEWVTTKEATCSDEGEMERSCDCGEKENKTLLPTGEHTEVVDAAVAPTCTEAGLTEGKHCSECGLVILAQTSIDAKGHTEVVDDAVAPTCAKNGLTEGKHCSVCNTILVKQDIIPTLEHELNTTYSFDNNFHWYACSDCGFAKDKAEHQLTDEGMCTLCDNLIGTSAGIVYKISDDGTYAIVVEYNGSATKVIIPETYEGLPVTTIYSNAFYNSDSIVTVIFPNSLTSISDYAFYGCDNLSSVIFPDNPTPMARSASRNYDGLTSIGDYAFYDCDSLISIDFPDTLTSIGDYAFRDCSNLSSIDFPDSLTSIGTYAFYGCDSLSSVVFPDSLTYLGSYAFWGCDQLQFNEYEGCNYLGSESNPYFVLSRAINENLSTYTIHEDTVIIAGGVFYGYEGLSSITIPDNVISIGNEAFRNCHSLSSVVLGNSLTYIGTRAFLNCNNLSSIVFPDSLTYIDYQAFSDCHSLTSLVFGDSLTYIGDWAFENCVSLTSVVFGDSLTYIGGYAFDYCQKLKSVVLPDSLTYIGSNAFSNCYGLTNVYYTGSEEEWQSIEIGNNNSRLTDAKIHYNYVPEE